MITDARPDPRLAIDPRALRLVEPPRAYFRRSTRRVARDLVGAWIARRWRGKWYGARIVETEAYLGPGDRAAHSWNGRRTPRVEPMYADGGHLYVFLVYGMHHCANVVTRHEGVAEAVLLRAAEPPEGAPSRLLAGPGKLCAALGITTRHSGGDLLAGPVRILVPARRARRRLGVSPRIGIDYAGDARHWPLRFYDPSSAAVSR
jgi:DNA-3-methyladenine glycosylase